jgi:hypothetical protein
MANRRFTSQFSYSFERQAVRLMGSFAQTDLGAFASLVDNGITYTAITMGSAGDSISIALVAGGTAGAEVVTVSGNSISVQIESGVSTRTQVETAIEANLAAAALVSVSVSSGGTAATLMAATPLAGGDDTDFTESSSCMSLSQIGTGVYMIQLPDSYAALIGASIMLQRSSAVDLISQIQSVDVISEKQIKIRMQAGSTPTNLANSDVLYISLELRNSSNVGLG